MARAYGRLSGKTSAKTLGPPKDRRAMKTSLAAAKKRTADLARERKRSNLAILAELR